MVPLDVADKPVTVRSCLDYFAPADQSLQRCPQFVWQQTWLSASHTREEEAGPKRLPSPISPRKVVVFSPQDRPNDVLNQSSVVVPQELLDELV